jgi:hypothetical protein
MPESARRIQDCVAFRHEIVTWLCGGSHATRHPVHKLTISWAGLLVYRPGMHFAGTTFAKHTPGQSGSKPIVYDMTH